MRGVARSGIVLGIVGAVVVVALVFAILDTEPDGDRIAVTVEIAERAVSSMFLGEPYTLRETLIVEPAGDVRRIAEAPWPISCWEA